MSQVRGTPEGRIFLAGANGHLYELQYQSYLSWFGKRCKLVNQSSSYFSFLVPSALRFLFTLSPLPSGFYFICALRPQVFIFFVPSALRFYFLCPLALRPKVLFLRQICNCPGHTVSDKH